MKYTFIFSVVFIILQVGIDDLCLASAVKEDTVRELYILVDSPDEVNDTNLQYTHIIVSNDKKCIASFCRAQISGPIVLENPPVESVNINVIPGIEYGDVNSIKKQYAISGNTLVEINKSGKTIANVQTHLVKARQYRTIQIKLLGLDGKPRVDSRNIRIVCLDSLNIGNNTYFQADARVDPDEKGIIAFRAFKGHKYKAVDNISTPGGIIEYEYPRDITFDSGDVVWKLPKRPSLTIQFKKHSTAKGIDKPLAIRSSVGISVKDGWRGGVNGVVNNRLELVKNAGILKNAKEIKIRGLGRPPWKNYEIINPVIEINESSNQIVNIYLGVKDGRSKILLTVLCNIPIELGAKYFISSRKNIQDINGCLENRGIGIDKPSHLTPGSYHLVTGCEGYNVDVKKLNLTPTDSKNTVKVSLEKSVSISGKITNAMSNKPFSSIAMDVRSTRFPSLRFKSEAVYSKTGRFSLNLFDKPDKSLLVVAHQKLGYAIVPLKGLNINSKLNISMHGIHVYGSLILTKNLKALRTNKWDIYWISMRYPGFTANTLNNFEGNDYSIYLVPGEYQVYVRPDSSSYIKAGRITVKKDKLKQKDDIIIEENNWNKRIDIERWW